MKKSIIVILAFTAFYLQGCDKYPDGPDVSLLSPTERVSNDWVVSEALDAGSNVSADYENYELNLTESGLATLVAKYNLLGISYDYTIEGTWVFMSNEEKISFDFDNNSADGIYEILRLTKTEMWLKEDAGTLELHFMPR